jgi:hypothetical protein
VTTVTAVTAATTIDVISAVMIGVMVTATTISLARDVGEHHLEGAAAVAKVAAAPHSG